MPKHEAQGKLADYITQYAGKLIRQGASIAAFEKTFEEMWSRPGKLVVQ
jgi:hypothetical protein